MYSHIAVFVFLALSGQSADLCCGETVEFEFGNLRGKLADLRYGYYVVAKAII